MWLTQWCLMGNGLWLRVTLHQRNKKKKNKKRNDNDNYKSNKKKVLFIKNFPVRFCIPLLCKPPTPSPRPTPSPHFLWSCFSLVMFFSKVNSVTCTTYLPESLKTLNFGKKQTNLGDRNFWPRVPVVTVWRLSSCFPGWVPLIDSDSLTLGCFSCLPWWLTEKRKAPPTSGGDGTRDRLLGGASDLEGKRAVLWDGRRRKVSGRDESELSNMKPGAVACSECVRNLPLSRSDQIKPSPTPDQMTDSTDYRPAEPVFFLGGTHAEKSDETLVPSLLKWGSYITSGVLK